MKIEKELSLFDCKKINKFLNLIILYSFLLRLLLITIRMMILVLLWMSEQITQEKGALLYSYIRYAFVNVYFFVCARFNNYSELADITCNTSNWKWHSVERQRNSQFRAMWLTSGEDFVITLWRCTSTSKFFYSSALSWNNCSLIFRGKSVLEKCRTRLAILCSTYDGRWLRKNVAK